ncbi:hypothetical protein MYU51_020367 [Penicillium brevicompactum]
MAVAVQLPITFPGLHVPPTIEGLTQSSLLLTRIVDIDPAGIHGHIFKFTCNGEMQAYEDREGSVPSLDGVNPAFFKHLADYVRDNDLESLLGLQVLAEDVPKMMCEFVLEGNGTVMLDARDVKNWNPYTLTTAMGPFNEESAPPMPQDGAFRPKME